MKILVVHSRYRSAVPSGENRVVDQECAALAELGHQVFRFERSSDDISAWPKPKQAALPALVVWNSAARRELTAALRAFRPDVVHLHNTFPLLSASVLYACRSAGVPVVATLHNYKLVCASGDFFRAGRPCHDCDPGRPFRAMRHGCYRGSRAATAPVALSSAVHRAAWRSLVAGYVFISKSQRDLLRDFGFPRERVFVRYNMIPAREVPLVGRKDIVAYAGRLDAAKGLPVLMRGWDHYRQRAGRAGLRLVIAGSGPLEDEVADWAATRPSVQLTGQLDAAACASLMASARAVILPSAWEETFGLAAVEAMALGVPPVAAAHGSFRELVTDGVDGALFRAGDPRELARVLLDIEAHPERYEEFGAQARNTYERRHDPAVSMRELTDIYEYAMANPVSDKPKGES
jgi:glycosyltransferase involved in cell wall biosynthesis